MVQTPPLTCFVLQSIATYGHGFLFGSIQLWRLSTRLRNGPEVVCIYIYIYSSPVAAPLSIRGSNPRSRIYIYIYSSPVAAPVFCRPGRNCQMALSDCFGVPSRSGPGQSQLSQEARLPQMASPHHCRTTFWWWEGPGWNRWPSEDSQGFDFFLWC